MAEGKEEKKEDKGKEKEEKKEEKGKEKKEGNNVIDAIYKVNLHCQQCGRKIKKHLLVTQGVQNVETDMKKGEIKVKGKLDPLKILKLIEKKSNKKVELISPKIKVQPPEEKPKEIKKEPIIRIITAKVHMHCDKCERDLKKRLIKHKGIFSVKTDQEAEIVTIEGSIEHERFLRFLKRKVHKNAEIISSKEEKKVEDKGKGKQEEKGKAGESTKEKEKEKKKDGEEPEKKEKGDEKSIVVGLTKEKEKEKNKDGEEPEKKEKGEEKSIIVGSTKEKEKEKAKEKEKGEEKSIIVASTNEKEKKKEKKGTQIIQIQEDTKVEIVAKDNVPYIIHYVYAPQIFSDENPNACYIS
ncbi:heavy metal-associated isoprenylated plant protein 4 [Neltuma alba]|uniref:heavy metal-associated isoprenylated plant protein 4 n=1 Tax=Neltuma alba TaxID=207710 RepID=UPI0010A4980F|nr:heavy metal-associated isoprenylated plant protein 4 [Prosopis alba]